MNLWPVKSTMKKKGGEGEIATFVHTRQWNLSKTDLYRTHKVTIFGRNLVEQKKEMAVTRNRPRLFFSLLAMT